jgi:hypothetical protein
VLSLFPDSADFLAQPQLLNAVLATPLRASVLEPLSERGLVPAELIARILPIDRALALRLMHTCPDPVAISDWAYANVHEAGARCVLNKARVERLAMAALHDSAVRPYLGDLRGLLASLVTPHGTDSLLELMPMSRNLVLSVLFSTERLNLAILSRLHGIRSPDFFRKFAAFVRQSASGQLADDTIEFVRESVSADAPEEFAGFLVAFVAYLNKCRGTCATVPIVGVELLYDLYVVSRVPRVIESMKNALIDIWKSMRALSRQSILDSFVDFIL